MPETSPAPTVLERVEEIVADVLGDGTDGPEPDQPLAEAGVDSLAMIEVVIGVEQAFGVRIADEDVAGLGTVADVTAYVESRLAPI